MKNKELWSLTDHLDSYLTALEQSINILSLLSDELSTDYFEFNEKNKADREALIMFGHKSAGLKAWAVTDYVYATTKTLEKIKELSRELTKYEISNRKGELR